MASETTSGAVQGGMHGASVGARSGAAYGPWGALIGGIIGGVVGTVGGFSSGKKKKKAKKYARMANELQRQREEEAYRQSFLSQIRQARISRASMLATTVAAGAEEGSGSQGALSSFGAQTANTVEYLSVDRGRALLAAQYAALSGKNLATAQKIEAFTEGIHELGSSVSKAWTYGTNQSGDGVNQQTAMQTNSQNTVSVQGGMPYLNSQGQLQYVPQGQTRTMSY